MRLLWRCLHIGCTTMARNCRPIFLRSSYLTKTEFSICDVWILIQDFLYWRYIFYFDSFLFRVLLLVKSEAVTHPRLNHIVTSDFLFNWVYQKLNSMDFINDPWQFFKTLKFVENFINMRCVLVLFERCNFDVSDEFINIEVCRWSCALEAMLYRPWFMFGMSVDMVRGLKHRKGIPTLLELHINL